MTYLQALVLAAVQGATEFLPVSSSGHLVLVRRLLGWSDEGGLLFDIVLHAGSLAAILVYFWRDWLAILRAFAPSAFKHADSKLAAEVASWRRLPLLVLVATLPTVAIAPFIKSAIEHGTRTATSTGISMIMTALWFVLAERLAFARTGAAVNWRRALAIGCAQIVALLPGASRSGWTAAAGLLGGMRRVDAVRFAFYMAVPAIAGALVFDLPELRAAVQESSGLGLCIAGALCSFCFSLAAIHFCLRFFKVRTLRPFVVYLAAAGCLILLISNITG